MLLTLESSLERITRAIACVEAMKDVPVVLEGDKDVILGEAVKILSAAQRAGATQVAIAALPG